jgi:dihydroxynaphthoic acid synthetase
MDATKESYHPDPRIGKRGRRKTNRRLGLQDAAGVAGRAVGSASGRFKRNARGPVARSFEDILYEVADARATITINRPDRLNAFRSQTIRELSEAFEAAADDESVGVIVFTGAGERAFCVGGDVREPTRTAAEKRALHHLHDRLGLAIRNNGKPIIVKVRGYCIGGGNELNVLCDLTVSGASGRFGQAGPKIGSAPLWWGCQLLPAVVGEKKAREILYLTRQYSAEEALAMGLVNAVVPDEELDAEVDRWCAEILRRSPQGLRLAKLALNAQTDQLYSAVQHGLELVALNHVWGPEPKEGIASFQEKRPADWRKFREGQGPEPGG